MGLSSRCVHRAGQRRVGWGVSLHCLWDLPPQEGSRPARHTSSSLPERLALLSTQLLPVTSASPSSLAPHLQLFLYLSQGLARAWNSTLSPFFSLINHTWEAPAGVEGLLPGSHEGSDLPQPSALPFPPGPRTPSSALLPPWASPSPPGIFLPQRTRAGTRVRRTRHHVKQNLRKHQKTQQ